MRESAATPPQQQRGRLYSPDYMATDRDDRTTRERRTGRERRSFFRGGRRVADWPATLTQPLRCPRCGSTEAKFVEGTPETLFWQCHRCRRAWTTNPEGALLG
jgi:DNA-directed RNA polymerase subunit M/transcription elongation factor TFIIS